MRPIPRRSFGSTWLSILAVVAGFAVVLLMAAPVALADCPPTDPLCLSGDQLEIPPPPTLPPVPGDVDKAVDDVVDSTKAAVDKTAGQVTDTIDGLVDPGGDDPGGGGGDGGGGGGGGGGGRTGPSGGPGLGDRSGNLAGDSTGSVSLIGGSLGPATGRPIPAAPRNQPGLFGRIGGAAVQTAKQLGFPLALAMIVVAFAMIQNYLDRRDPKLALAPVRPEVMRFE